MITWKELRKKIAAAAAGTADDPDWVGTLRDPNTITATVGGVATAGAYVITITIWKGKAKVGTFPVSFTRVAEDNDGIASGLEVEADGATATEYPNEQLSKYVTASVTAAVVTFTLVDMDARAYFEVSAPDPGTLTLAPDAHLPIAPQAPNVAAAAGKSAPNVQTISIHALDTNDVEVEPGTGTVSLTAIEVAKARVWNPETGIYETATHIVGSVVATLVPLARPFDVPLSGAFAWTMRITAAANIPANTTALRVIVRDSIA